MEQIIIEDFPPFPAKLNGELHAIQQGLNCFQTQVHSNMLLSYKRILMLNNIIIKHKH